MLNFICIQKNYSGIPNRFIEQTVTCGNIADPRIEFGVDVAEALTLVFKSNEVDERTGLTLLILEYDPDNPVRAYIINA